MDERINRLPKWARTELENRDREIARLREALASRPVTEGTVVWTNFYGEHPRPVAERGEHVRFNLDGSEWVDVMVDMSGTRVNVMGSTGLAIKPHVTNSFDVEVVER